MDEIVHDLAIDEFQNVIAGFDQRHRHIERREDRRVFDADHAATDHRQRTRQMFEVENFVAIQNAPAIERHIVRPVRMRARRDQRVLEGNLARFAMLRW